MFITLRALILLYVFLQMKEIRSPWNIGYTCGFLLFNAQSILLCSVYLESVICFLNVALINVIFFRVVIKESIRFIKFIWIFISLITLTTTRSLLG